MNNEQLPLVGAKVLCKAHCGNGGCVKYASVLRSLLKTKRGKVRDAQRQMENDWDARARENARHYIATSKKNWSDDEFFRSGTIYVHDFILSDLTTICNGRFPQDMRVLEIGCGAGRLLPALAKLFGEVHGVDISSEMISRAREALSGVPNIRVHKNNGVDLSDFKDAQFDFVFSAIVFQHIPNRDVVENYIRESFRVLRPGSAFKFQVQGHHIPEEDVNTWVGVGFSEDEMRQIAQNTGFSVLSMQGAGTQYFWLTFSKHFSNPSSDSFRPVEI